MKMYCDGCEKKEENLDLTETPIGWLCEGCLQIAIDEHQLGEEPLDYKSEEEGKVN
jgi:hypothetical protein